MASVYDYPEYYDILFGWDRDDEAGAYRDALHALNVDDDAEVLEVAAGTAQIGLRLARAGYRVTALDSSAAMLEYAAKVAAGERLALTTLVADMTAFSSDTRFAAAMNPMSSFRLLVDDDDVGRHLACMAVALVPGGLYLLDLTFGTDGTPESDLDEWVMARDDVVVSAMPDAVHVVDRAKGRELALDWHEKLRPYTAEEFSLLVVRHANFEVVGCYRGGEPDADGTSGFCEDLAVELPSSGRAIVVLRVVH